MSRIAPTLRTALLFAAISVVCACGPKYPNCKTDDHCEDHQEVCLDGTCVQCRDDSQCTEACYSCGEGNTCARAAGCCTSDLDCQGGKCWMAGETGQCGDVCDPDHPCPSGQRCVGGSCVPDVTCSSSDDCQIGEKCDEGSCVAACSIEVTYFDFDSHILTADGHKVLKDNASCLADKPGTVIVEGHCDPRGEDEYNLALGQRRANSVKRALRQHLRGNRTVRTISFGEERLACNEDTEDCWYRCRRAETRVEK